MKYGYRVLGKKGVRKLVDAASAFAAYAACDPRAEVEREAYLSAFTFGDEFRKHLEETGSTRDYFGPCGALFLWWDKDHNDLDVALADTRRLVVTIKDRYAEPLCFFSGKKGFHVGLPTALWNPAPSLAFNRVARRFAEAVAERAGIEIDTSIYDKVRAFRAPNSRHATSGLFKVRLRWDELMTCTASQIQAIASEPRPFEMPVVMEHCQQAADDWHAAIEWVERQAKAMQVQTYARLNRLTLDFIRQGAKPGERAKRLFSAAANLAEFSCPPDLAYALLNEPALDSGLQPSEVQRQIECGLNHRGIKRESVLDSNHDECLAVSA
jgi:hypothetical protein